MGELALRFVLGGAIVAAFSLAGEAFEPKTFSGIFGAAPSVAIATLGIAAITKGMAVVSVQARSMIFACIALVAYSEACALVSRRRGMPVWLGAALSYGLWLLCALGALKLVELLGRVDA